MALQDFDRFLADFLLVGDPSLPCRPPNMRVEVEPPEEYRIERLRQNFRLDLPSWREMNDFTYPQNYPQDRGPNVPILRESRALSEILNPILSSPPTDTPDLWRRLASLANRVGGACDYNSNANACNRDDTCSGGAFLKYVPFQSFSRYLPCDGVPRGKKWGNELAMPGRINDFKRKFEEFRHSAAPTELIGIARIPAQGELPNPMFLIRAEHAPHRNLPAGVTLGSSEAACYVIQKMALPGYEQPELRRFAGGIIAIEIPKNESLQPYRPTVLEAAKDGSYFFLPSPTNRKHGLTWPLVAGLDRNDFHSAEGLPEWIATGCPEFPFGESILEIVGSLDDKTFLS
jgi:hypothetical protein